MATQEIYAGEQVSTRRFAPPREQGIRSQLRATERGIQIAGDPNQVLAGTLKDHDYVDIVGTWDDKSRIFVRNALVLKAPEPVTGSKLGADQESSVQLRVTDIQAQKLKFILELGQHDDQGRSWHLLLRPPVKSADSPNTYQNGRTMITDGPGRRAR